MFNKPAMKAKKNHKNHKTFIILIVFISFIVNVKALVGQDGGTPDQMNFNLIKGEGGGNFTGALQLNIPILTVPGRNGLDYKINLNYHSGGYNTTTGHLLPTWVGDAFNLNIGRITRTVVGRPDEQAQIWYLNSGYNLDSHPYDTDPSNPDERDGMMRGTISQNDNFEFWDVYYLQLPEGTFRLLPCHHDKNPDPDLTHYLDPYDPLDHYDYDYFITQDAKPWKIVYNGGSNNVGGFQGIRDFTVTKEDGTRYIFNLVSNLEICGASSLYNGVLTQFPVSWELTKILSPDYVDANGNQIADDGDYGSWIKINYTDNQYYDLGYTQKVGLGYNKTYGHYAPNNCTLNYDRWYVKSIETPNYIANFITNENDITYPPNHYLEFHELDQIILETKYLTPIKHINFTYLPSYPTLSSVQEIGDLGNDPNPTIKRDEKPPMKFTYYGHIDEEGSDNNTGEYFGGSYSLQTINYPEGGTVTYTYEKNDYNWFFNTEDINIQGNYQVNYNSHANDIPGARVKYIDVSDGMGSKRWSYFYGEGYKETVPICASNKWINNYGALAGNGVEYRWVKTDLPDSKGSITDYYTTGVSNTYNEISTPATNPVVDVNEMQPDKATFITWKPTHIESRLASHGLIWKTQIRNSDGVLISETNTDYDCNTTYGEGTDYYTEDIIWSKNNRIIKTTDGISNLSKVDNGFDARNHLPLTFFHNGSKESRTEKIRKSKEDYASAYLDWVGMGMKHMFSEKHYYNIEDDYDSGIPIASESLEWQEIPGNYPLNNRYYPVQKKYGSWDKNSTTVPMYILQDQMRYDNYGNLIESLDANTIPNSTFYGMKGMVSIGNVKNARYNQAVIYNFDDHLDTSWSHPGSGGIWSALSGWYESHVTNTSANPAVYNPSYFSPSNDIIIEGDISINYAQNAALAKYINATHMVEFVMDFTNQNVMIVSVNGGMPSVTTSPFPISLNEWYHLKGEINGNKAILSVNGTVIINCNVNSIGAGYCGLLSQGRTCFDNIRFYPSSASVVTMSYDSLTLKPNWIADENGNKKYFNYDSFGRVISINDGNNNMLKSYSYIYSRNISNGFSPSNPNCVEETSYRSANDYTVTCKYYNGLGRLMQTQVNNADNDIINHFLYDAKGNIIVTYKHYEINNGINRHKYDPYYYDRSDDYSTITGESTDQYPYYETQYSNDDLNRVSSEGAPGSIFKIGGGHDKEYSYLANNASDTLIYDNNEVYKEKEVDENGNSTYTYKDQLGFIDGKRNALGLTQFSHDIEGRLTQSIDPRGLTTDYTYGRMNKLSQMTSPDAGTVQYLYDMNGNLRFIKDANHTGTAANNVVVVGELYGTSSYQQNVTLSMPGTLSISLDNLGSSTSDVENVEIKTLSGDIIYVASCTFTQGHTLTGVYLPKGTYQIIIISTASNSRLETDQSGITPIEIDLDTEFDYDIRCQTNYPFVYRKYDNLNRLVQEGEYISNTFNEDFTQVNADNKNFPTGYLGGDYTIKVFRKQYSYDELSADPLACGQRNLKGKLSYSESYDGKGELVNRSSYSYDNMGRIEWIVQKGPDGNGRKIAYEYDLQGNIIKKSYIDISNSSNNLYTWYTYDQIGRLNYVYTNTINNESSKTQEAGYTYFADGSIRRLVLGNSQGVDYLYNQRGWLKRINHQNLNTSDDPGHDGPGGTGVPYVDKFGEVIGYANISDIGSGQSATPQYNGNISWLMYQMKDVNTLGTPLVGYTFTYDNSNRLTMSNFGYYINSWLPTSIFDIPSISYDNSGNFMMKIRNNNSSDVERLKYTYQNGTNRLNDIVSTEFNNQLHYYYNYDGNGNVTKDDYGRIKDILYNYGNLPTSIITATGTVNYSYDVNGNRIRKQYSSGDELYILGADGQTEAVYDLKNNKLQFWNINAGGQMIGRIDKY